MFIHRNKKCVKTKTGTKIYTSILLMESYREGKKVKHHFLANLSKWPSSLVVSFEKLLKGETFHNLEDLETKQGKSCGALIALHEIAKEIGITKVLGNTKQGKLSLLMVLGRILTQGSRLRLCTWKDHQAIKEVLKIGYYDEDDLYETLDWLCEKQEQMEKDLFKFRFNEKEKSQLFLYDVTSSYFEGQKNELGEYGYNRDRKKGKKQIVIGILTDKNGVPVAVEVFKGNTTDSKTLTNQIKKLTQNFGVNEITFVGDRGMIKSNSIEELQGKGWHYITAITKSQIKKLLKEGVIQLGLFEEELVEIIKGGVRYILRRNPERQKDISKSRDRKITFIKSKIEKANTYLKEHTKASIMVAERNIMKIIENIKMRDILKIVSKDRMLTLAINQKRLEEESYLDGCYVIKTDLKNDKVEARIIHERYKDLTKVEQCFSNMKTELLEVRPIYLRKANRTRAHVFVTMLAYMITKKLFSKTKELGYTHVDILNSLNAIQYHIFKLTNKEIKMIHRHLLPDQQAILNCLKIKLPSILKE